MTDKNSQISQPSQQKEPTGCIPVLLRIFWLFIGSGALILITVFIAQRRSPIIFDVAFWVTVIALISVRYVDIKWFKGETSDAEPATLLHWRQYSIRLLLVSCGFYALARIVAHFKLI